MVLKTDSSKREKKRKMHKDIPISLFCIDDFTEILFNKNIFYAFWNAEVLFFDSFLLRLER